MTSMILDGATPRSRPSDPVTSVDAGRAADLSRSQSAVYAAMRARSIGVTQQELEAFLPGLSPSRVRSAVSELAEHGLVATSGKTRPTKYGRKAQIWEVTA